jgi:hypothetical protein
VNCPTGTLFTSTSGKRLQRKYTGTKTKLLREVEREVQRRDVRLDESRVRDNKRTARMVPPFSCDARSLLSWDRLVGGSYPPGEGEHVSPAPRQIEHPPHSIASDTQHYFPTLCQRFFFSNLTVSTQRCDSGDEQDLGQTNSGRQVARRPNFVRR